MHVFQSDDAGVPENELPPKPEQTGEKQTDSTSDGRGVVQSDDAAVSSDASSKPEQKEEAQTDSESAEQTMKRCAIDMSICYEISRFAS